MNLLVLGGTAYLSHAVASLARDRGHDVTAAARGITGSPPDGVRFVRIDRDVDDGLAALDGSSFDAVVDVSRTPSQVRRALDTLAGRTGHWTFVSTISVYADLATPWQSVATSALRDPTLEDEGTDDADRYGRRKVACERHVADLAPEALIVRSGLIIGPGDPQDRFGYWPRRISAGGEIIAPGDPDDEVQHIDVRDLAGWILDAAETGTTGTYDGVCRPYPRRRFLHEIATALESQARFTWIPQEFLTDHGVNPWAGPDSLGLWAPLPEYGGLMTRDPVGTSEAGLVTRPLGETAVDWLRWYTDQEIPPPLGAGLDREKETAVLAAWHDRERNST